MSDTTFDALRANPENPRTITPQKAKALKAALLKFGDLGGVVYNRKTGHVVGGHQRLDALKADANGRLDISTRFQTPTKTGTVAEGVIFAGGERYGYREVEWDKKTEKAAAIACNSSAGAWDMTGLTSWLNDLNSSGFDMSLTMFNDEELMPYLPDARDLSLAPPVDVGPQPGNPDGTLGANAETPMGVAIDEDRETVPVNHVKAVQLFFDEQAFRSFIECADSLREVYKKDNLSETVLEAVRRASISAAIN